MKSKQPSYTMVNGFDPATLSSLDQDTQQAIKRRMQLLGPAYRLMYAEPLEIVRGAGTKLYDQQGKMYLDAYNNVPCVGHAHPKLVESISKAMATLCTHTRYIQEGILHYAETILPTLSANIEHIMFTCSGSEANDLALRLATYYTKKQGVIITSEAYHGNSFMTSGFSPSLGVKSPLGTWVRRVPTPDSYRYDSATLGQMMAEEVQKQIDDLQRHGDGLAAFYADSLFSSDGIYAHPADLLAPVIDVVHKAGGLFIADEVQSGFGRSGDKLWGYQRHGITPDIVTMGKPMGSGYPVAAVALSHEIVADFGTDMRYFNTFGGNTVAIAAAQATWDILQEEHLQENAYLMGKKLRQGLRDLAGHFTCIGDVRGAGLYIGVEIVSDREAKTPDSLTALAITNEMRRRGVLISATGYHANVLKIRPPLAFSAADVTLFLNVIEDTLTHITQ